MSTKDSDRTKALETKVAAMMKTMTETFKISRNKLTDAEECELLRNNIRGKVDTLREKFEGMRTATQPSYGHGMKQLETVDNNLDAILDRVCGVYNDPEGSDES